MVFSKAVEFLKKQVFFTKNADQVESYGFLLVGFLKVVRPNYLKNVNDWLLPNFKVAFPRHGPFKFGLINLVINIDSLAYTRVI